MENIDYKNLGKAELDNGIIINGYKQEYIFEIISKSKKFYEHEMLEKWTKNLDCNIIFDIGANIGNHSIFFSQIFKNSIIYSFEPMPENYKILEKNILDNNLEKRIKSFDIALGNSNSDANIKIAKEKNLGTAKIIENKEEGSIKVKLSSIDFMDLPAPDFIKIDTEGYEFEILKGMENTLKESKNLILWIEIDYDNSKEIFDFLYNLNFKIIDIDLSKNNNIIFKKNSDICLNQNSIFSNLMNYADISRKRAIQIQDYKKNLEKRTSQFIFEQKKAEEFKLKLNNYILENENLEKKNKEIEKSLQISISNLEKAQKELDMFINSKIIKFMRYWVWHISNKFKTKTRISINKIGKKIYIKLLPYPKIRLMLSKINRKIRIFKDTDKITSINNNLNKKNSNLNKQKMPKEFNIAIIADEFSYNSFKFEFNAYPLDPSNWIDIFEKNSIDIFFCESAWSGIDSEKRPWKGKIYASENFKTENRGILLEILDYCKSNNIPTVFWNKEDPTHYSDRIHDFVKTAILFDYIFTTDYECVQKYKDDYGHKNVNVLMFATQPILFNPIEEFDRRNAICFAGSWYRQHKERCIEMEFILDSIIESRNDLIIYDRFFNSDDNNHKFLKKYEKYLNPPVSHNELKKIYKSTKFALNINTVVGSKTMFARRVFELASSNTFILSNYSKGIESVFGDNISFIKDSNIDLEDFENRAENAMYTALNYHTYKKRFEKILDTIGFEYKKDFDIVEIRYFIQSVEEAKIALKNFNNIYYDNKICRLIIKKEAPAHILQDIMYKFKHGKIKISSENYIEKYNKDFDLEENTKYIINANNLLDLSFIKKAMLHSEYLENDVAICFNKENKYVFGKEENKYNVLIPKNLIHNKSLRVYYI